MGKWTQGPWRAEASDYEGCLQIISADRKRPITEIWGDGDDDEANARLIAAAPELAEALRMVVAADTAEDWSRAVDYARKALAKAGVK